MGCVIYVFSGEIQDLFIAQLTGYFYIMWFLSSYDVEPLNNGCCKNAFLFIVAILILASVF